MDETSPAEPLALLLYESFAVSACFTAHLAFWRKQDKMQQEMKFAAIASESQTNCTSHRWPQRSGTTIRHGNSWRWWIAFCFIVADEMLKRKLAESVNISSAPARSCNNPKTS